MSHYLSFPYDLPGIVPGSARLRSRSNPAPAAGANWTITCPGGFAWLVRSVTATLTTDATAANRLASLRITDGEVIITRLPVSAAQGASVTAKRYTWAVGAGAVDEAGVSISGDLLRDLLLLPGWTIGVVTSNLQAGDTWSAQHLYVVEYDYNQ